MIARDANLVIADAVDVVLVEKEPSVIDQKLPHRWLPIGEHVTAGPALVREVEAAIQIAVGLAIVEPEAPIAKVTPGVVVDAIENDSDPIQVKEVSARASTSPGVVPRH